MRRDTTSQEFSAVSDRAYTFDGDKIVRIEDVLTGRVESFTYDEDSGNLEMVTTRNTAGDLLTEEIFTGYDNRSNPRKNLPGINLDVSAWIRGSSPNNFTEHTVTSYTDGTADARPLTFHYDYIYNDDGFPTNVPGYLGSYFFNSQYSYTSCGE